MDLFFVTLTGLFSVVNPLGAMPVFLSLTSDDSNQWRITQVKRAAIYLAGILIVFFLLGTYIMSFFGITIEGMRIAGGIIIANSGLALLNTKTKSSASRPLSKKVKEAALQQNDISFSPLAMPMLSGPGSISLLISLSLEYNSVTDYLTIIASIICVAFISFLILRVSPKLVSFLGETGIAALSRMMGFLVLAIGIQFIANGILPMINL